MERTLIQNSRAWWSATVALPDGAADDLLLQVRDDGALLGELRVAWYSLNNELVPRLEVFSDGWQALAAMPDLLEVLAAYDGENVTPAGLCTELVALGFADVTPVTPEQR